MSDSEPDSRCILRELHHLVGFMPRTWQDTADHAFINNNLIERSIAWLAPELGGELLDVGCGQRPYASYFAHAKKQRACDFDGKRGPVDFVCPADQVPLPDASLDSILCTEVLEHVPDPDAVWSEFRRLLRPGGKVLLTTPMYWPPHELPHDFYRYPEHGLRRLANNAGFEVMKLIPRGGVWALLGQIMVQVMPQYLRFSWQRKGHNWLFLKFDAWRCNPNITLGWTMLATKR
jgi:SAM-dependent methyltransferase